FAPGSEIELEGALLQRIHLDLGDGLGTCGLQGFLSGSLLRSMVGLKIDERVALAVDGVAALYLEDELSKGLAQPRDLSVLRIRVVVVHGLPFKGLRPRTGSARLPRAHSQPGSYRRAMAPRELRGQVGGRSLRRRSR